MTPPSPAQADPKGLIREAYRIPDISAAECRAIFTDWALSLPDTVAPQAAMRLLLAMHGAGTDGHPMTALLRAGLAAPPAAAVRRGGRRGRQAHRGPQGPGQG